MNIALVIIDVQEAFIGHRREEKEFRDTFEYINYTANLFRKAGKPVFIVRDIADGTGSEYANVPELEVEASDIEVLKTYNNSFWKTDLEKLLRDCSIDFLVLCGNAEEYCVSATYNGAAEREFGAALLQKGVFAASSTGIPDMLYNKNLVAYNVLEKILED